MDLPITLLYAAVIISFYTSFMGGANDFANAFGTSVGSGAIRLRHAVLIAIIAEFAGAIFVGGHVTDTVRKGIVNPLMFEDNHIDLVLGLMAALIGSGVFLQAATWFGLPVSTSHSIVGALVGFGIIATDPGTLNWSNIGFIAISWIVSPIGGAIVAFLIFRLIQNQVLESHNPQKSAATYIPIFVGLTFTVIVLSMLYKGLKNIALDTSISTAVSLSLFIGMLSALVVWAMMRRSLLDRPRRNQLELVEDSFKILQVLTAAYVAFAHGANDVANSVGPLAGIVAIYSSGIVGLKTQVPIWILALGGTGIIAGLAIFGKRVINTVGSRITLITPSRGFSAEFSTATIVLVFSKLGMPVSTTHTLVGSVIGVGFARGLEALDLRVIGQIVTTWVITLPLSAGITAGIYYILKLYY